MKKWFHHHWVYDGRFPWLGFFSIMRDPYYRKVLIKDNKNIHRDIVTRIIQLFI